MARVQVNPTWYGHKTTCLERVVIVSYKHRL
jgi:hypothetical protein